MSYHLLCDLEDRAPVWNSTFKIIEAPMSYMNKLLNVHGRWLDQLILSFPVSGQEFSNTFEPIWVGLKTFNFTEIKLGTIGFGGKLRILGQHLYDKKITILATVGQIVAYPISWIFTPITAIADIFAGVIQATVRTCQGASKGEIQSILHRKVIAAPAQQLAYTISNFVVFGPMFLQIAAKIALFAPFLAVSIVGTSLLFGLPVAHAIVYATTEIYVPSVLSSAMTSASIGILVHSLIMGDSIYRDAQGMVGKLPKFLIPDGYNIFIENGALDEFNNNAFNPEEKYAEFKKQKHAEFKKKPKSSRRKSDKRPFSSDYTASIKKDLDNIKEKDPSLKRLRDWFEGDEEPYTLFGFDSEDKVTEAGLKNSYRKLSLKYHPDKCLEKSKEEATILFKMINTAREDIEKMILKIK